MAVYQGGRHLTDLRTAAAAEDDPAGRAQMVATLATLGDVEPARAALPTLQKAAANDRRVAAPTTVAAAQVRAASGQVRDAVASLDALILESPQSLDVNYFIGRLRQSMGDGPGAIAAYQLVIGARAFLGANPVVPASRLALAELLMKQGNQDGAREQLDALLKQWKDADTEFEMLTRARRLRAGLQETQR
jgi:predicted Zn-dependent protease